MKNKFNIYKVILIGIVILLLLFVYFNYTNTKNKTPLPEPHGLIHCPVIVQHYDFSIGTAYNNTITIDDYILSDLVFEPTDLQYTSIDFNIPEEYTNKQNVHDSNIQKTTRGEYDKIKNANAQEEKYINSDEVFNEITSYTGSNKINNVSKTLDTIKNRNENLINIGGDTELNVLLNTWNSYKDNENIRNEIINSLYDSVEDDKVVCSTGVVTRIVNSINIEDPEKLPKNKEIFTQEMLNTASYIRNKLELDGNSDSNQLKKLILEQYKKDYIDKDILSKDDIIELTKDWIDYI